MASARKMELTSEQQHIIKTIFDTLSTPFTQDKEIFKQQLKNLKLALSNRDHDTEDLTELTQYFHFPQKIFNRLEDQASKTFLGDVQYYVLYSISQLIYQNATQMSIPLKELEWDEDHLVHCIPKENFSIPFVSEKIVIEEVGFYELPVEPGRNFSGELVPSYEARVFHLKLQIEFPPNTVTIIEVKQVEDIPDLASDEEDDKFLEDLKADVVALAEEMTAHHIIEVMLKENFISSEEYAKVINVVGNRLFTSFFYINFFLKNQIQAEQIAKLTPNQTDSLLDPIAISFIKNKLCNWKTAKKFTKYGMEVIAHPYYYAKTKKDFSLLQKLGYVTEEKNRMLLSPHIIDLQKNQKISLVNAKRLPVHVKPVIAKYKKFFLNENVRWRKFRLLTEENCKLLVKYPVIFDIISKLAFDKEEMTRFSQATVEDIKLITAHPPIKEWMLNGILDVDELKANDLTFLFARVFARRLFAIFEDRAFDIYNIKDDINRLWLEFPQTAQFAKLPIDELHNETIKMLVWKIEYLIKDKIEESTNPDVTHDYEFFKKYIADAKTNPLTNWMNFYEGLATMADQKMREISTKNYDPVNKIKYLHNQTYSLFLYSPDEHPIKLFCKKIIALSTFNKPHDMKLENKIV